MAAILYYVGFFEIMDALSRVPQEYFLLLLAIQLVTMLLSALKWRIILKNVKVSFINLTASTFVGYLINNINPVGVAGGEPVKAYLLSKREKIPAEYVFASVLVDLFLEIFPLFLLSAVAILLVLYTGAPLGLVFVLVFSSAMLLFMFFSSLTLAVNRNYSRKIVSTLSKIMCRIPFLGRKVRNILPDLEEINRKFNEAVRCQMLDLRVVLAGTFVSVICWVLRIFRVYVAFKAVGVDVPVAVLFIVEAVVILVTFVPVSPGALGIWEGTSIALFILLVPGLAAVSAATVALIDRVFFSVIPSFIGVVSAVFLGVDVFRLAREEVVEDKTDLDRLSKVIGS